MTSIQHWAVSHPGAVRRDNEDAYLCRPEIGLFAVADGVGGRPGGCDASMDAMRALVDIPEGGSPNGTVAAVRARLQAVHEDLRARGPGGERTPATTVVVLLLGAGHLACLWAGDSRAYLLRGGQLVALTEDHSLVADLVRAGRLTAAEAERHPKANVITRAIGAGGAGGAGDALLDKVVCEVEPGDRFLLCSDGLTKAIGAGEIAAHLAGADPADALLAAALDAGAKDNVTAVVAGVEGRAGRSA